MCEIHVSLELVRLRLSLIKNKTAVENKELKGNNRKKYLAIVRFLKLVFKKKMQG